MRAKAYLVGGIFVSVLTTSGVEYSFSAVTASSGSSVHDPVPQWKITQEDLTTWKREPFKRSEVTRNTALPSSAPGGLANASSEFALQGIMKSNSHFYAIINGRTFKAGDRIEGWSVAEISRYRVTLRREKEKQIYDIYQGRIDRGIR